MLGGVVLRFWHGGKFEKIGPNLVYSGGQSKVYDRIDSDELCYFWLAELACECGGYTKVDEIHYLVPGESMEKGLRKVYKDEEVLEMAALVIVTGYIELFVVHGVDEPEIIGEEEVNQCDNVANPQSKTRQKLTPRRPLNQNIPTSSTHDQNNPKSPLSDPPSKPTKTKKPTSANTNTKRPSPAKKSNLAKSSTSAAQKHPSEAKKTTSSAKKTTSLAKTNTSVANTTPSQAKKSPTLAKKTPSIAKSTPSLAKQTASTTEKGDSSNKQTTQGDADDYEWEDNKPESPLRYEDLVSDVDSEGDPLYEPEGESSDDLDGNDASNLASDDLNVQEGGGIEDLEFEAAIEEELRDEVIGSEHDTSDEEFTEARNRINKFNHQAVQIAQELQREAARGNLGAQKSKAGTSGAGDHTSGVDAGETGFVSDYDESGDEALVDENSDGDGDGIGERKKRGKLPKVDENTDYSKLKWKVGMTFPTRKKFKDAVARFAIIQGRSLKIGVSNKIRQQRVGVVCVEGCPFYMYGSWDSRRATFVVKAVDDKHTCNRNMKRNRQLKSTWAAQQFLEVFKARPHWPAKEIMETIKRAYKVLVTAAFAYRVKYNAHKLLHGSMKEHYGKLGRYVEALKSKNPTSVFLLVTTPAAQPNPPVFQRMFVCFDGLSKGWYEGCRKVICIDACFLKTFLGGVLIAAVGRDANDQMFPIAWAVAEGENTDSWNWFLMEFKKCFGGDEGNDWTIISDQHLAIINAVAAVYPGAEHRHCARHIFANWHKAHKAEELEQLFWRAAKAYNEADYMDAIQEMEVVSSAAAAAFKFQNPKTFCRAFMNTNTRCDVIVNNMAETFNGYIIHARVKHIIHMLEDIRTALMQRLFTKSVWMTNSSSIICPRIQAKLEKEKDEAANCGPVPSSLNVFQVSHKMDSLSVDLEARTCTCRKWDICGFPCCHAISCIFFLHKDAEEFVDDCYKRETYLKSYSGCIKPCEGERYWPKVDVPMDPPPIKIGPGRPRRNRRKAPHENPKKPGKLTRHGAEMTCSVCKSQTHTKRKCPDKDKVVEPQPKRPRGRPRKEVQPTSAIGANTATTGAASESLQSTAAHHAMTATTSRTGRGGRLISSRVDRGRVGTSRGGRGKGSGRGSIPTGFGVYFNDEGSAFINPPNREGGPVNISASGAGFPLSTQASVSTNFQGNAQ